VIFGLAFTLLLIASYPERKKLLPERPSAAMKAEPAMSEPDEVREPEKAS